MLQRCVVGTLAHGLDQLRQLHMYVHGIVACNRSNQAEGLGWLSTHRAAPALDPTMAHLIAGGVGAVLQTFAHGSGWSLWGRGRAGAAALRLHASIWGLLRWELQ